ncbi:MAG: 3-oxoacyl-ACP reductase FabG [Peptococcaceae bacterium]|nr:3-oxoacyl-ACP reductase FabG [Peptococcaceae bacterium]
MRLRDKVCIVTGASKGLGRAFCLKMAAQGAKIVAAATSGGVDDTVAAVRERGGEGLGLRVDVSREEDCLAMVRQVVEKFGRIDVLVNNAAVYYGIGRKSFMDIDPAEWDRVMAVNVRGPWLCSRAVFPSMREKGRGKIINLASEVFFTGSNNLAHYVASKGGVVGLTRALAREAGPYGICVNAVAPGFTDTEASRTMVSRIENYDVAPNCLKRLGTPEDVVGAVLFLASEESDFVTGQTILVDGGRVMH